METSLSVMITKAAKAYRERSHLHGDCALTFSTHQPRANSRVIIYFLMLVRLAIVCNTANQSNVQRME